jgi:hypothetical protein
LSCGIQAGALLTEEPGVVQWLTFAQSHSTAWSHTKVCGNFALNSLTLFALFFKCIAHSYDGIDDNQSLTENRNRAEIPFAANQFVAGFPATSATIANQVACKLNGTPKTKSL